MRKNYFKKRELQKKNHKLIGSVDYSEEAENFVNFCTNRFCYPFLSYF